MSISDKLVVIAENEQKVFDAGYKKGKQEGGDTEAAYNQGVEDGKKAEYDYFWDIFQRNGERSSYQDAFEDIWWNDAIFKPKYNLIITNGTKMFYYNRGITNIKASLENCGVVLDTSGATKLANMFYRATSEEIPTIDLSSATDTSRMFYSGDIITIEKVIFSENTVIASNIFNSTTGLENIEIGGEICSDISFSACTKLTLDSLMSIINHLKDFSGTTTTKTCTLGTTNLAKLTDAEKKIATDKGWSLA